MTTDKRRYPEVERRISQAVELVMVRLMRLSCGHTYRVKNQVVRGVVQGAALRCPECKAPKLLVSLS